jgi:general secretion pathway protein A
VLEQLRLLTNLETNQRKLLQIIILGQPELLEILSRENMRQLAQRITARFHLNPLSRTELKAYLSHRLAVSGSNIQLFDEKTIKRLYQLSGGVPRIINIICDRALLGAYVENKPRVDVQTLNNAATEVFGEIQHKPKSWLRWPMYVAAAAGITGVSVAVSLFLQTRTSPFTETRLQAAESAWQQPEPASPLLQEETAIDVAARPVQPSTEIAVTDSIADAQPEPGPEAGREPVAVTVATDSDETDPASEFTSLVFSNADTSKAQAYADLFDIWNKDYTVKNGSACTYARNKGLSCLHRQGNLRSLAILNRPAVLKFYDEQNKTAYALLTQLNDSEATLRKNDRSLTVPIDTLNRYWLGEYTLLWQVPPYYTSAVQPGSHGPIVQWLDQQLVRLYGQTDAPTIRNTYNEELMSQIIKFQQSKGLMPDGVVGPHTFILLNSELEAGLPMLNTRKG